MSEYSDETTSRVAEIHGLKVHYHDAGEGEVVILLHGGGPGASSWSNFKGNIAAFADRYRVLMIDQPGFGRSGKPQHGEQLGGYAARVIAGLMDHLGIERAHFVGNSMGGHVSLKFALDFPERTGRLVLMAPSVQIAFLVPVPTEGAKLLYGYHRGGGATPQKMRQFLQTLVYDPDMVTDELVQQRYEISSDPESVAWTKSTFFSPNRFEELWRDLEKVRHKTLLFWGRDDRVVPLERALFMLQRMPDVELHAVARCGHWVMIEHPETFNRVSLEFLGRD